MWKRRLLIAAAAVAMVTLATEPAVDAAGGSSPSAGGSAEDADKMQKHYSAGLAAIEARDYEKAEKHFEKARGEDDKHPDVLNMLAYTQRKLGKLDQAFENYERALTQRKRYPQAREYLAEAHLQASLEQLVILQSYGDEAAHERKLYVQALRRAAASLNDDGSFKQGAELKPADW